MTLVAFAAFAAALGGCGRKGGLDLPPGPSAGAPSAVAGPAVAVAPGDPAIRQGSLFDTTPDTSPVAERGARKRFLLDPLLD